MPFPAPDKGNGCKNQFIIVHKHINALQEECTLFNRDVSRRLDHCESATHDLSGRLLGGLGDMNTKLSELMIDDMFVKTLQWGVESTRSNLEEFKKVYTSFREKAFAPLLGNVDANNLCVNELVKDVTSTRGDVRSLTQKVQKLNQTLSLLEKGTGSGSPKLRPDLSSSQTKSLGSDDSCLEGVNPRSQRRGSLGTDRTDASHNITQTIDTLRDSISNLEIRVTHVETQCRQSVAQVESASDDVCCSACARVADGLSMNIRNVNTLYNALLSTGLLTDKVSGDLITNFRDGRQVVGPLFSTPSEPKGKNGIISFASPINVHPRGSSMGANKTIGNLRVDETLSETNDMGVNKKVYKEQLKLIPVFNGEDTSKFRPWIKRIEKSVNSGFYNPHRVCHLKAEGAIESFISKHLHEDWDSLKAKLRTRFSDLCTTQDCVKAVRGCKQGKQPMISYIDEFEELIAGMDSGQGYIQNFVDGLSDLHIKNIILVWWNEGSIRTISEAFDLAMEKETSYSNLVGSGDELLLMTSTGASDVIVQRISAAVCENMKKGHEGEYDLSCGFDLIPANFLKNHQYGSQGNFPPSNNTRSNNDTSSGNNKHFIDDFPSGNNARFK